MRKIMLSFILPLLVLIQNLNAQDDILFRKYLVNSGINGFFYGLALDVSLEIKSNAAAGMPIITAGTSVLIPLLTNSTKTISANSLILSSHGKFVGWAHGFALSTLISGENAWTDNGERLTLAMGAIGSISLGILGNHLGKTKDWTEGQASLYRLYGWSMPLSGTLLMASLGDNPRLVAAGDLIFGAAGYLVADRVYKHYPYTRGDTRAIQVVTIMTGGLGLGILSDIESESSGNIIFPALGIAAGSILGQAWLKNANLTPRQGMNTAYAATGGAIFGLGIALMAGTSSVTPYYVIPYVSGMITYGAMVESYKKKNATMTSFQDHHKNKWDFAFMPQNLYLNSKIAGNGYKMNGRPTGMQPLFAASLRF